MKRLLLSSLLIDHTSCFFSPGRTTVPNAANHAADAASSVTLLCVLCVAIGSPAHDKKRGVRHHLRDDRRAAKERTVLITPSGGCASLRDPLRRGDDRDRLIFRLIAPDREENARQAPRQRDDGDATAAPRGQALDPRV